MKLNLYIGYYEAILTDKILRKPYTYEKSFRIFDRAVAYIERYFPSATLVVDRDIARECYPYLFYGPDDIPEDEFPDFSKEAITTNEKNSAA